MTSLSPARHVTYSVRVQVFARAMWNFFHKKLPASKEVSTAKSMFEPKTFAGKSPVPVYALAFPTSDTLIYAGGGGKSKSGVSNVIVSFTEFSAFHSYTFSKAKCLYRA